MESIQIPLTASSTEIELVSTWSYRDYFEVAANAVNGEIAMPEKKYEGPVAA
jgi:hypothetical protein